MAYTHIAHDCRIGNHVVMANAASLGAHCFSGLGSAIRKDVPPFAMVGGHPAKPHGINSDGLRRRAFGSERISAIKRAYRTRYTAGLSLADARERLIGLGGSSDDVRLMAEFVAASERSIVR